MLHFTRSAAFGKNSMHANAFTQNSTHANAIMAASSLSDMSELLHPSLAGRFFSGLVAHLLPVFRSALSALSFVILALSVAFLSSGCSKKPQGSVIATPIADLTRMPQSLDGFAKAAGGQKRLVPLEEQQLHAQRLTERHYAPWQKTVANPDTRSIYWAWYNMKPEKAYTAPGRRWVPGQWEQIQANSNMSAYPSRADHAIILQNTNLRAMPAATPWFLDPTKPGEGYPFDYFQNSSLPVGAPVLVAHTSRDGQWVLVETSMASGWVPANEVAPVNEIFKNQWMALPLVAIVEENVTLTPSDGMPSASVPTVILSGGSAGNAVNAVPTAAAYGPIHYAGEKANRSVTVFIGTLLPRLGNGLALPVRSGSGFAAICPVTAPASALAAIPLPLTPDNIALIGNRMMGQAYGWGGIGEKRDCSSMLRDLYAPFGFWLPRNSSAQARWGRVTSLQGLAATEKEQQIRTQATPFLSLIWLPGHIGLYLGEYKGSSALFHDAWGVLTRDPGVTYTGRAVIGKVAVTSLRPGAELSNIASPASILDRMERISTLPEFKNSALEDMTVRKSASVQQKKRKAVIKGTKATTKKNTSQKKKVTKKRGR